MKSFCQKSIKVLSLEKDDPRNLSKMQLRVWKFNNNTTILIRLFKSSFKDLKHLWNGKRTNGEVVDYLLCLLKERNVILNIEDWEFSVSDTSEFSVQDEFEEKKDCVYFSWSVKSELLNFLN